jgi:hypothetical protein
MREEAMDVETPCGRCGRILRPGETIIVAGPGELCLACFNAEMAQQLNVDFDDTRLAPVVLNDHDGAPHTFEIRSRLAPTGHVMEAIEVPLPERGGYRFAILADFGADAWDLLQRLYQKMRAAMAIRHIARTEHGWQIIDRSLTGRIEWDPDTEGTTPALVVDGQALSWDEVGRMLITFEGFTLEARVEDTIEIVGGPLADGGSAPSMPQRPRPTGEDDDGPDN